MAARRTREPLRTCVGCRRVRTKSELVRIVGGPDGRARLDRAGVANGRGAYVCPDRPCIERAQRRLAGALRMSNIDFTGLEDELLVV